jgi:hypothetical protein
MVRRFMNVTGGDPDEYAILMFVIAGNAPRAEFSPEAIEEMIAAGQRPAR